MAVHIIAEAGSNYNGKIDLAYKLNKIAYSSGANSVKYQIINPEELYNSGTYKYGKYDIKKIIKIRQKGKLTDKQWLLISKNAKKLGIDFSASIFDFDGLKLLIKINPSYIKISSSDLNNIRLLRQVSAYKKKIILSTGMSTIREIENSLNILIKNGLNLNKIVLLHCVSVYPLDLFDTNLSFIKDLKQFGTEFGFSDHTLGTEAACAAVALGATWIEKHITTNNNLSGLDHKHALNKNDFFNYVSVIRSIENSLKNKKIKIIPKEMKTKQRARRGMYISKNMKKGEILKNEDILIVRPENKISADKIDFVLGKKIKKDLKKNKALSFDLLLKK